MIFISEIILYVIIVLLSMLYVFFLDLLHVAGFSSYFFPALPCLCLMASLVRRMEFGFVLADYAFAGGGDVYEWYSSMFFQEANSSCCSTGRLCVVDFLNR